MIFSRRGLVRHPLKQIWTVGRQIKACRWGGKKKINLALANLTRLFHPATSFRDCLWLTERWKYSQQKSALICCLYFCISRQRLLKSQMSSQVLCYPGAQIPCEKCGHLGKNKILLLGFCQTFKVFIITMIMGRGTGFLDWHGWRCCLDPHVSHGPITCSAVTGWCGGSERGVWDPHQNLWPFGRSRIAENSIKLLQLPSILQLLTAGTSALLSSFNMVSASPLPKLPLVLFSSFLFPKLTAREQRQCSGYLRTYAFVEIHGQGRKPPSSFLYRMWAEEGEVLKKTAFFINVLVVTTLKLRLGGHDPCSNFVNEQILIFFFKQISK